MNQEKILRAKMITAIVLALISLIVTFVFAGLYSEETKKTRRAYITQYEENLTNAAVEIDEYIKTGKDYDLHYNMIISDMGAARSLVFLISGYTEQQKTINELHYCFVKYPEQMSEKLEETSVALWDITDHLDKGYDEAEAIVDSIDKKGS
jgi:hypothetical protein